MKNLKEYIKRFLIHGVAILPIILLLDFGMGIQLFRDYSFLVVVGFMTSVIFYKEVCSRFIDND